MSLAELISILSATLATHNGAMADAVKRGDLAEIAKLTPIIAETERTLAQLKTL
jgi:hypothetical protein